MSLTSESGSCGATFAADSWSFVIDGTKATLTATTNGTKKMLLEKVGD